ncbi:MAG TPA: BtpA/SgcQ family protein [Erysipelotrichaceae bacterium]|nr:BtpA/SgcQ family protein [Erysipelotrichia bacterium]HPX31981.1 BtpA/SgcQ family protein [Erysipelotrichaceae bacterium]HQA84493.1 BtpA/SgcQ family protein [Erysipelotrichaceae bacterium]
MKEFFRGNPIIGMVHLLPLPGAPKYRGSIEEIKERALYDANALVNGGVKSFIIENFNDDPYSECIDDFSFATMVKIANEIKNAFDCKIGINIQFNDVEKELALAYAIDADFIRVEVFIDNRVGIQGIMTAKCRKITELKNKYDIRAKILADIDVKHTTALVKEDIDELAHRAIDEGADAIILTGSKTGENPKITEVERIREIVEDFPIVVGSGINSNTIRKYLRYANGVIVGSSIKIDGNVKNPVCQIRTRELVESLNKINY